MKYIHACALFFMTVFHTTRGLNQTNVPKDNIRSEAKDIDNNSTRFLVLGCKPGGVYRYDGKTITVF